jgi:hypothetical protein
LPQLRRIFRYTDYATLERRRADVTIGTPHRFPILAERWLEVAADEVQGKLVRMRVQLLKGDQPEMSMSVTAAPGAPAILGGPPYGNCVPGNCVLIIILWAHTMGIPR